MAIRIASAGFTDTGAQREANEDAILVDDARGLYVVCDGMGGHASGQVASTMAIAAISEAFGTGVAPPPPGGDPLASAMVYANARVYAHAMANETCRGMGTTAVGAHVTGDSLQICHVGDSRAYLLRNGQLVQLTRDHSLINLYADHPELAGQLGPAQSNVIVRAVGLHPEVEVAHQSLALFPQDVVVMCSDGLVDMVPDPTIREILLSSSGLEVAGVNLIGAANTAGGVDNISVILLHVLAG
jgi:serine/threonine protein phosphatase PrpC